MCLAVDLQALEFVDGRLLLTEEVEGLLNLRANEFLALVGRARRDRRIEFAHFALQLLNEPIDEADVDLKRTKPVHDTLAFVPRALTSGCS